MAETRDGRPVTAPTGGTGSPSPTESGWPIPKKGTGDRPTVPEPFTGSGKEFAALAPELTEQEQEALNRLFRPLIFRIARKGEYWTSCCRRHVLLNKERTVTPEMRQLMEAPHTPEPEYSWRKLMNPESEHRVTCPHCGAEARMKELGRTGGRKNLYEWRRAVVLRWWNGALWAVGVNAWKSYLAPDGPLSGEGKLTRLPGYNLTAVCRFRPGLAEEISRGWWDGDLPWPKGVSWQTEPRKKGLPCGVGDPFGYSIDYGKGYDLIGWEEIDKSPFRYVNVKGIREKTKVEPLRVLTLACFYAEKLEMLHKFGMDEVIHDLADRGVKTAWLLNWTADKPKAFLRLPMKPALETAKEKDGLEALRLWKANGLRDDLEDCLWLAQNDFDHKRRERIRKLAKSWGLRLGRIVHYLSNHHESGHDAAWTIRLWMDYLDAAEHLGLDLNNDIIRFPKDLLGAHDQRTGEWAELQKRQREALVAKEKAKQKAAYAKRYKKLCQRYAFAYAGLTVVIPGDGDEIVAEGKALKHCVGGYAARHLEGATTILFLRDEKHPEKPLVTIEISGKRIVQAHGYKNEMEGCPENPKAEPPRQLYSEFFDSWLGWLKKGSPRDKDGNPELEKKKSGRQGAVPTDRKAG